MNCKNCGFINKEGNRFCISCGSPLEPEVNPVEKQIEQPKNETISIIPNEEKKEEQLDIFTRPIEQVINEDIEEQPKETLDLESNEEISVEPVEQEIDLAASKIEEQPKETLDLESKEEISVEPVEQEIDLAASKIEEQPKETLDLESDEEISVEPVEQEKDLAASKIEEQPKETLDLESNEEISVEPVEQEKDLAASKIEEQPKETLNQDNTDSQSMFEDVTKELSVMDFNSVDNKQTIPEITTTEGLTQAQNATTPSNIKNESELQAVMPLEEDEKLIHYEKPEKINCLTLPFSFILKPIATVKEKVSKLTMNDAIAVTLLSIVIITILLFVPSLIFNKFDFSAIDYKNEIIQKLAYTFIAIIGISVIYFLGSLVTKEKTKLGEILGLTSLTAIPFVATIFVLVPILNDLALISGITILFIGILYSLLVFIFGMNEITLFKTGEGKLYYHLVCLGLIIIVVLAFYQDAINTILWDISAFN